ncbi:uncharacterized protein LOC143429681 isoform X2 [Xylocopa sonorina]|uniref:uncharacterized protein LOC143429681 isoform X2 n=1 Tax=Xylocopa sonorina TaxID=1818115 RepID=UPI00403B09E8
MDSMIDDDLFALSDEELPIPTQKCNPIEEHLIKQLSDVKTRIEKTKNDIKEVQDMTKYTLDSLYSQARYGRDITSKSDNDLYTVNREPVVKKIKKSLDDGPSESLGFGDPWKRILFDKWIIGIPLINFTERTLINIQIYFSFEEDDELYGTSMIWKSQNGMCWDRSNKIKSKRQAVGTIVLDLPKFDKEPFYDVYGTILYEIDEKQYQTPLPVIRFSIEDIMDSNCQVMILAEDILIRTKDLTSYVVPVILTLKSASVEKVVDVNIKQNPKRKGKLRGLFSEKSFHEICPDIYISCGCLTHCLIEILYVSEGKEKLRISARSGQQMNIVLQLLRDQFPDMIIEEDINIHAAQTLIEELKLYLDDEASTTERQIARIRTDLLIP